MEVLGVPTYKYKGNPYHIVGFCKFKDPNTREWHDAIMYQRADEISGIYVREREEFYNRFKLE